MSTKTTDGEEVELKMIGVPLNVSCGQVRRVLRLRNQQAPRDALDEHDAGVCTIIERHLEGENGNSNFVLRVQASPANAGPLSEAIKQRVWSALQQHQPDLEKLRIQRLPSRFVAVDRAKGQLVSLRLYCPDGRLRRENKAVFDRLLHEVTQFAYREMFSRHKGTRIRLFKWGTRKKNLHTVLLDVFKPTVASYHCNASTPTFDATPYAFKFWQAGKVIETTLYLHSVQVAKKERLYDGCKFYPDFEDHTEQAEVFPAVGAANDAFEHYHEEVRVGSSDDPFEGARGYYYD